MAKHHRSNGNGDGNAASISLRDAIAEISNTSAFPDRLPSWPPDAFAVCASILQRSGGYIRVVENWPPNRSGPGWNTRLKRLGRTWRRKTTFNSVVPDDIERWWEVVIANGSLPLHDIRNHDEVACALLQIIAAADEACSGAGLQSGSADIFDYFSIYHLQRRSTLCSDAINPARAVVLPKLHTPQAGITMRSLTHNLALYAPGEVEAVWKWLPFTRPDKDINWNLRLLLLPWPKTVKRSSFHPSNGTLRNLPPGFGFFRCDSPHEPLDLDRLKRVFERARKKVADVDGIIFPELALREDEAERAAAATGAFVVSGVGRLPHNGKAGANSVVLAAPLQGSGGAVAKAFTQSKHHRWKLDRNQIKQYGLQEHLDLGKQWWEHIEIGPRKVHFVTMTEWLTVSFLICEDLARLDPVSHLLHSVGPNLVICLLMDGPQLKSRWPARYSTVLADDPGSSVLTLTSLGMASASKPVSGKPKRGAARTVALWKDAVNGDATEIKLSPKSEGIVLSLRREPRPEWSADGRQDAGDTAYLVLDAQYEV